MNLWKMRILISEYLANKRKNKSILEGEEKIEITSLDQYRDLLEKGVSKTKCDFSKLNLQGENIEEIDLENLKLKINLREVFIPFNGKVKYKGSVLAPIFYHYGEDFLYLNQTNLKGNNVIGAPSYFKDGENICYIWYTENTFDEYYKKIYPKFFLDPNAPNELKEKYYKPKKETKEITNLNGQKDYIDYYIRQTLTFEEYMQYYQYLQDKYIDNFYIAPIDKGKIKIIRAFGLDHAKEIIINLSNSKIDINFILETIAELELQEIRNLFFNENSKVGTEITEAISDVKKRQLKPNKTKK